MKIKALMPFSTGTISMEQYEVKEVTDTIGEQLVAAGVAVEIGGGSGGGVLVVTDTNGTLDKTWAEIDAADCVVIRYNDGSRDWRLTEVATGEGKGGVAVWAYMGNLLVQWGSETESGYPTRGA